MADTDTQPQPPPPGQPPATPQNAATLQEQIAQLQQLLQARPVQAPLRPQRPQAPTTGFIQSFGRGLTQDLPYPIDPDEERSVGLAGLLSLGRGLSGPAGVAANEQAQQMNLLNLQREQQQQQIEQLKASEPVLNLQMQLAKLQAAAGMPNYLAPQPPTTPPGGGFAGAVKGAESGGNASARAPIDPNTGKPISSAAGPAQFIEDTWNDFLKSPQGAGFTAADRVAPPGADAATVARVQAANDAAVNWYAGVNNQAFQDKFGRQATPAELGSGHLLGTQGAIKLAQADPNALVKDVLPANFISNNPHVLTPNMTVANARQSIGGFYGVGGAAGVVPATAPAPPGRVQIAGPPSAVTQPPAAQPTPDQSQLPTPPVPPAWALPTATQPESVMAEAAAARRTLPYGTGAEVTPEGEVRPSRTLLWPTPGGPAPTPGSTVTPPAAPPAQPATPPAATVTPPETPAPQPAAVPPELDQSIPDDKLTYEQYRSRHAWAPTPQEMARWDAPAQALAPNIADAQRAKAQAAAQLRFAQMTGGDTAPALTAFNNANSDLARAVGSAASQGGQLAQDWQKNQEDILQKNFGQSKQLAQEAALKTQELAQQAAEKEKDRQQQTYLEKTKAGYTAVQHQVDAEQTVGSAQLGRMGEAATKAEAIQPMLMGLIQLINNPQAPQGALGQFLASHQEWLPVLKDMGIVDPTKATISQLMKGLTDFMSLDLKPQATGAMRIQEIPMLQGLMPNMATDKATQQQALARVLNYTQRVKAEYDFATEHFGDNVIGPDGKPVEMAPGVTRPNYKIMYKDIDAPMQLDENGRRVGGGLGAPVPTPPPMPSNPANASSEQIEQARRYMKYTQNLPSGMPYNTWERDPQTGQYTPKMYIRP